ncbi:hypothetical protein PHYBOEH_002318 [Phytophthora boehmeriae]|uniref:Uncharacterized protein n=1 Tax=Phytophthora boehmeriae TaxID=109152 RepID=A0A8T1WVY9_9STRA|nr:hypothetical protein PHYBOEH_002318 [Phytophthora boehmeriae]
MGRYTTTQTFSDQDAQGAAVSYDAAATPSESSTAPAATDKPKKGDDSKLQINRVDNVSGSSAGAGSGDFHTYRAARRREMERVAKMEERYLENKAQQEFETKRKRKAEEFEAKMNKKADKRRRRKERAKARSMGDGQDEEGQKETNTKHAKRESVPETPGGVAEIPNDGSFLEKMLAMQKAKEKV